MLSSKNLLALSIVSGGLFVAKVNAGLTESQEVKLRFVAKVNAVLTESQEARLRADAKRALMLYYDTPCGHSKVYGGYEPGSEKPANGSSVAPSASHLTMSQMCPSQSK